MEPVDDPETQRLLELLDQAIRDARRSRRDLERSLGLGQGYLGSLFRGRIELKVWHVYRLARELKLDPLTFFFEVSPPEDARWVLRALGLDPKILEKEAPARQEEQEAKDETKEKTALMTVEEIEAIIQKTIRVELERRGLGEPENPEGD